MKLRSLFGQSKPDVRVKAAYDAIVSAAREPALYREYGVPDTFDGRFESLVLHMHLVLRRLKGGPQSASRFAQNLFDTMFDAMDVDLREMGAGDMGVGKRVKDMARAFYGRAAAYDAALDDPERALPQALERNLLATTEVDPETVKQLTRYVREQIEHLQGLSVETIMSADLSFQEPSEWRQG